MKLISGRETSGDTKEEEPNLQPSAGLLARQASPYHTWGKLAKGFPTARELQRE